MDKDQDGSVSVAGVTDLGELPDSVLNEIITQYLAERHPDLIDEWNEFAKERASELTRRPPARQFKGKLLDGTPLIVTIGTLGIVTAPQLRTGSRGPAALLQTMSGRQEKADYSQFSSAATAEYDYNHIASFKKAALSGQVFEFMYNFDGEVKAVQIKSKDCVEMWKTAGVHIRYLFNEKMRKQSANLESDSLKRLSRQVVKAKDLDKLQASTEDADDDEDNNENDGADANESKLVNLDGLSASDPKPEKKQRKGSGARRTTSRKLSTGGEKKRSTSTTFLMLENKNRAKAIRDASTGTTRKSSHPTTPNTAKADEAEASKQSKEMPPRTASLLDI